MKVQEITREALRLKGLNKFDGHKFSHGHALIVSGGRGHSGAARLAARGALRIGAGLVTLAVPGDAAQEVACQITAVMMQEVGNSIGLREILRDDRINALCIGPGLGTGRTAADLVGTCVSSGRKTVLDADALTLVAQEPDLRRALHAKCILTPHGGEFARLFPDLSERLAQDDRASKATVTLQAAQRIGCTVLLKGAQTVIAHPDGDVWCHDASDDRAVPWLATAGSGDVLAGFVAGLCARGQTTLHAAQLAVYLHVEAAIDFGPGLIAEDLPEYLPRVMARLVR